VTTLLLDADIIAFKIASVSQKTFQFPDCEPHVMADDWDEVVPRIHRALGDLQETLKTDDVIVCLSCPTAENWRLDFLPTYKANRDYSKRPVHLAAVKDYMEATWPSYRRPRLEADDIMGILSTSRKGTNVIVSEDKDMKTIPGWLFNPAKDSSPHLIDLVTADRWHMHQTMVGDVVDGYTGCPGAGPTAAQEILDGGWWTSYQHTFTRGPRKGTQETRWELQRSTRPDPQWADVVSLYERFGFTEADALIQARVARILRATDYNFNTKEVIPWTPK
jgi:DNA polymerase-1